MDDLPKIVIGAIAVVAAAAVVIYFGNKIGATVSRTAGTAARNVGDAVSLTDKNLAWRTANQVGDLIDDGRDNQSFDLGEIYRARIGANP